MNKETIVVWFSCGAASAVAAWLTVRIYGSTHNVRVVNNMVKQEDADNRRFLNDVEQWIGQPIEQAQNPKYPDGDCQKVWDDRKFVSGPKGAPCTLELKKKARYHWEDNNTFDWLVMGFTSEEQKRHDNFVTGERSNILPVLIDAGLNKQDCAQLLTNRGIELPLVYRLGYPNANCIGCVKATSPTYWNHVRKEHPEVFIQRAETSRKYGAKLVRYKGVRIQLDELPIGAKGAPMKSLRSFDCGLYCEEPTKPPR